MEEVGSFGNPQPSKLARCAQNQWSCSIDLPERESFGGNCTVTAKVVERVVRVHEPAVAQESVILASSCTWVQEKNAKVTYMQVLADSRKVNDGLDAYGLQIRGITDTREHH